MWSRVAADTEAGRGVDDRGGGVRADSQGLVVSFYTPATDGATFTALPNA